MPLIRPREDECSGAACGERTPHLRLERLRLSVQAAANAVRTHLGEYEWLLAGEVLEPPEVSAYCNCVVQIQIEREEVEERQAKGFGTRVVHVRDQSPRRHLTNGLRQPGEERLDATPPVPAHERSRDLVPNREAEERGMPGTRLGLG